MCDSTESKFIKVAQQMNQTFNDIKAAKIYANDIEGQSITTQRLIMEGISLNGLMIQRLLSMQNSNSNASIDQLAASVASLQSSVESLSTQVTTMSTQLGDLNTRIEGLANNNSFIDFLKTQLTFYNISFN